MTESIKTKTTPVGAIAFSIDAMSKRVGLSRAFLYEQIKAGRLKTFKIGKRRLVHVEDESAYLATHREAATATAA